MLWGVVLALLVGFVSAMSSDVLVVTKQLTFDEVHTMSVDSTTEYILEFQPRGDDASWPSRVWVRAAPVIDKPPAADPARPLLITARQRAGAQTWQLPYHVSNEQSQLLYELERTLCPDDIVQTNDSLARCGENESGRVALTLHVSTSCAARTSLEVRVSAARDWQLAFQQPAVLRATQVTPLVSRYQFSEDQDSVRLTATSEDDVCTTLAVQNYKCPFAQTQSEVAQGELRMTMQRSGGVQLTRSQFPRGFIIVAVVHPDDTGCSEEERTDGDSLWEALWDTQNTTDQPPPPRDKNFTITIVPALTRSQYAIAASATVLLCGVFYIAFGALVWAQQLPYVARLVGPRAVLAPKLQIEEGQTETDATTMNGAATTRRRRRDSDATFDSSDGSESDSEDEHSPPTPASPDFHTTHTPLTTSTPPATNTSPVLHSSPSTNDPPTPPSTPMTLTELQSQNGANQDFHVQAIQDNTQTRSTDVVDAPRPFGLPAHLNLAALSRHRDRTLRSRSDRYLHTLYTVAVFYALPVLQFVAAFQIVMNVSGSLDLCYYNFLCAHPAGVISDFNHIFSNLGYLLLGALFMLQVRRRKQRRRKQPRHEQYGIPAHYGLLMALGAAMMMVALLSASYHVCPNRLNFQFDTAFMYVLAVLSMVKIYQSRHPDVNARAHSTFGVLAVLIALVVWGVLGGGAIFWGVFTVIHVFTFLILSLRIYYVGQFRLDKTGVLEASRGLSTLTARPLYTTRLVLLLIANAVNWAFAFYGLFTMAADFAGHLLQVLLCNTLLYMVFYLAMKLMHGERLRWYSWAFLSGAAMAWIPALYFFVSGSSNWSTTPALSRHYNHECMVLQFYDAHDLWHLLSAIALYLSFNAMLTWDDGLSAVKRTDIAVF